MTDPQQDGSLQDKAREQLGAAKDAAAQALATTRDAAQHAFETSRDAARQAAQGVDASNPLVVVLGGIAAGIVAAALIPKTERERELLAPVGKRINTTATAAIAAAKENAQNELTQRGLTKEGAQDQVRSLLEGLTKAVTGAGTAALQAAKEQGSAPTA